MDSTYLSNEKNGKWPAGKPVEFYLFIERWRGGKKQQRFVHEITAPTEERALDELRELASRPDVTLIEEQTRKVGSGSPICATRGVMRPARTHPIGSKFGE